MFFHSSFIVSLNIRVFKISVFMQNCILLFVFSNHVFSLKKVLTQFYSVLFIDSFCISAFVTKYLQVRSVKMVARYIVIRK